MSHSSLTVASAHGTLAALKRHHPQASSRIEDATCDLAAAKLAEYVRKVVATAPPLTAEQRETITAAFAGFAPAPVAGGASA